MRKNSPRKWLHAVLDLLPVVLIPVFMIYSHRHNLTENVPIGVDNVQMSYNRKYNTNSLSSVDDFVLNNYYQFHIKGYYPLGLSSSYIAELESNGFVDFSSFTDSTALYFEGGSYNNPSYRRNFVIDSAEYEGVGSFVTNLSNTTTTYFSNSHYIDDVDSIQFKFYYQNTLIGGRQFYLSYDAVNYWFSSHTGLSVTSYQTYSFRALDINMIFHVRDDVFNSTSVNTPAFLNSLISNGWLTAVSDSNNPIVSGVVSSYDIDYGNTTISNVFMDNFSNTVNTYLNFGNVFNLSGVWSWVDTNIFGGNASQFVYAIWNIIVYEFVIDLLFVFYAFFMFLIDFTECLLDKPFNKINRG